MRCVAALALLTVVGAVSLNAQNTLNFQCQDLPDAGLVLVPPSSPDYEPLLKDIQERVDHPPPEVAAIPEQIRSFIVGKISPEKRATSAILLNRSGKSIAALELVWRFEDADGRTYTHPWMNTFGKALLLPFSTQAASLKMRAYWNTILPGSKRYLAEDEMAGDNTDVRKPDPDEVWQGGAGSGGADRIPWTGVRSVTLVLDGVFFTDGEFVGADQFGLWEKVTSEAKIRMEVAKVARDGKARGISGTGILDEIGTMIGTAGPGLLTRSSPPPGVTAELTTAIWRSLAGEIQAQRRLIGDDRTVDELASQANTQLPNFQRR